MTVLAELASLFSGASLEATTTISTSMLLACSMSCGHPYLQGRFGIIDAMFFFGTWILPTKLESH